MELRATEGWLSKSVLGEEPTRITVTKASNI